MGQRAFVIKQTFIVPADSKEAVERVVADTHRHSVERIGGVEVLAQRTVEDTYYRGPDAVKQSLHVIRGGSPERRGQ